MTNKERIIIDGVPVQDCCYFDYENDGYEDSCDMYQNECSAQNCYYKQFKRKEQECEELIRKLSNQEQLYQNEIEIYNQSCLQLRQENDDLYLERLALNTANSGINALLEVKEQECDRYRKALEEIEEVCIKDTREFADGTTVRYDSLDEILDIINKVKDRKNEN